ncbi:hypothetical protein MM1218R_03669 [Mycobacterium marinum]|uniref:hypothetical protein n=1 Tax=Mycobacterium marinum TaxID=1781 RepID=UPI000E295A54|nr:hypothetical protein [Mycobacterium marinum]AXN45603.1 hypothetical protein MM1218R_03669 [Mycobacterium marinum]RFZ01775.1 hypothetical protein DE4381_05222 [Mycobacterium marinum]
MTFKNITLLQPDVHTLIVSRHPNRRDGDCVSVQFDDTKHGRFLLALSTETADYLATLFATAVHSPRIGAIADQRRAQQRESRP